MNRSDIIIIGAGPGGYETALAAAKEGKSVTLFNGGRLGGTCLNEGCIPTKCLCRNAEVISTLRDAETFGIDDFSFSLDYRQVVARKDSVVGQLREGIAALLKGAKVNV
ncbi:MAG: FAD-dependent oxidoreductase, partial [Muribaculaceae bacterium]|nr:FAD-dependent oxidoreductase [Muribaculaceae bacterium]